MSLILPNEVVKSYLGSFRGRAQKPAHAPPLAYWLTRWLWSFSSTLSRKVGAPGHCSLNEGLCSEGQAWGVRCYGQQELKSNAAAQAETRQDRMARSLGGCREEKMGPQFSRKGILHSDFLCPTSVSGRSLCYMLSYPFSISHLPAAVPILRAHNWWRSSGLWNKDGCMALHVWLDKLKIWKQ